MEPETAAVVLISGFGLMVLGLGVWVFYLSDELRLLKARFDRLDRNVGKLWADAGNLPRDWGTHDHPPSYSPPKRAERTPGDTESGNAA